jgi:hypothetical protein
MMFELLLDVMDRTCEIPSLNAPSCCQAKFHRMDAHTCTNQTVPYGTAFLGWRFSRHFVPGYDCNVPPGHIARL